MALTCSQRVPHSRDPSFGAIVRNERLLIFQRLGVVDLELVFAVDHRQVKACVQAAGRVEFVTQYRQSSLVSELPVVPRFAISSNLCLLEILDSDTFVIIPCLLVSISLGSRPPDQQSDQHHDHYLMSFVAASLFHSHCLFLDLVLIFYCFLRRIDLLFVNYETNILHNLFEGKYH